MADALTVTRNEAGTVRVFAVNLDDDEARGLATDPERLRTALGAERVDPAGVEMIRPSDLSPLTLSSYLSEGMGIEEDALEEDRNRLDSLGGLVLLIRPRAFGGTEQVLTPGPDLRLVGRYAEPQPEPTFATLPDRSAHGQAAPAAASRGDAGTGGLSARGTGAIILAILAVLLILFFVLS